MNRRAALNYLAFGLGTVWLAPACTEAKKKETKSSDGKASSAAAASPTEPASEEASATGEKVSVVLEVGDSIVYDKTRIEVSKGSTIELTIKHGGKLPKAAMGHNFVLLKQGTDMTAFATAAMGAAATEYIPAKMKDQVIANTKVVGGGESDTITFAAPAPGEYVYLCTFPGHYQQMNGKLVVS